MASAMAQKLMGGTGNKNVFFSCGKLVTLPGTISKPKRVPEIAIPKAFGGKQKGPQKEKFAPTMEHKSTGAQNASLVSQTIPPLQVS